MCLAFHCCLFSLSSHVRGEGRGEEAASPSEARLTPNPPPARPSQGEGDIRRGRRHERMNGSKPCVPSGDQHQICSRSVAVQIVAGRDDFAERGSASRSTLRVTDALVLSKRWAGKAPAGHGPALLWLRLRRVALSGGLLTCQLPPASNGLPITNRRYGRLKICDTLNRYFSSGRERMLSCRSGGFP